MSAVYAELENRLISSFAKMTNATTHRDSPSVPDQANAAGRGFLSPGSGMEAIHVL